MRTYILRRLIQIVPTVLGITFIVFLMMRSVPGDPVVALLSLGEEPRTGVLSHRAFVAPML